MSHRGRFIVFEGGDGVGKSTQSRLLVEALRAQGREVLATREPGGTPLGTAVRQLLLSPAKGPVSPRAEALLFAADRAQHVDHVLRPALEAGHDVVCDRYIDSSLAYQGAGRDLDLEQLEATSRWATGGLVPDLTVLLDLDPALAVATKAGKDRMEEAGLAFHSRVRRLFLALAEVQPHRYLVLDARTRGGPQAIHREVVEALTARVLTKGTRP